MNPENIPMRPQYTVIGLSKGAQSHEQYARKIEMALNEAAAAGYTLSWCNKESYGFLGIMVAPVPIQMPDVATMTEILEEMKKNPTPVLEADEVIAAMNPQDEEKVN